MTHRTNVLVLVAAGLALVAPMLAQEPGKTACTPDDVAAAIARTAAVGPYHSHLKPLVGKWRVQGRFRMAADAPWQEHKSDCTVDAALGGRFVEQRYKGEPMFGGTTPFEGIGFLGYDNDKQKYVSVWLDNMDTMIMTSVGTCDDAGKTLTFRSADFTCPVTKQNTYVKFVYQIEGKDRYVLRMYSPGPDGKEFEGMELVHTRANT